MLNNSGIQPLDIKILVKPDVAEEKTVGGIIIPDSKQEHENNRMNRGVIIGMGENCFLDLEELCPSVGDYILYSSFAGADVDGTDDEKYRLIRDIDVNAIIGSSE